MAELQQKLEVSCEWAYELERDVADLSLVVEGLRDVCAQLQHSLDQKEQQLAGPFAAPASTRSPLFRRSCTRTG